MNFDSYVFEVKEDLVVLKNVKKGRELSLTKLQWQEVDDFLYENPYGTLNFEEHALKCDLFVIRSEFKSTKYTGIFRTTENGRPDWNSGLNIPSVIFRNNIAEMRKLFNGQKKKAC